MYSSVFQYVYYIFYLSAEACVESEVEEDEYQDKVLVEAVEDHLSRSPPPQ